MVRGGHVEGSCRPIKSPITYTVYHKEPLSVAAHTSSRRRWPAWPAPRDPPPPVAVLVDPTGRYLARACVLPASQRSAPPAVQYLQLARAHSRTYENVISISEIEVVDSADSGSADRDASAHAGCTSARASVPNIRCIKLIDPPTAPAATAYANAATVLGKQNTGHRGLGKQNSEWRRPRMRPTGAECNQDQAAKLGAVPLWR